MAKKEKLIGHLRGEYATGAPAVIAIHEIGGAWRLSGAGAPHLCHRELRDIEELKREVFRVYRIWHGTFEPA